MIESARPIEQAALGTLFTWGVTALGSAVVYFIPNATRKTFDIALGFSAGVMLAASYWSLLAPAIELSEDYGNAAVIPSLVGFLLGAAFVWLSDLFLPQDTVKILNSKGSQRDFDEATNSSSSLTSLPTGEATVPLTQKQQAKVLERNARTKRIALLILAITIHNIPEGLAVGVGFAAAGTDYPENTNRTEVREMQQKAFQNARNLAIGIGIQNFPEGLAVSLPLRAQGMSCHWAFFWGQLSGMFEPVAGILGCFAALQAQYILPYALAFAAGAMVFVVTDDIIPEVQLGGNHRAASWAVMIGFCVMMTLDVTLG